MARPFSVVEREKYGGEVFELSAQGYSQRKIAEELGIARSTVQSLLREQRQLYRKEHFETIERTLLGIDQAIAEAWRRLKELPAGSASNAGPGLLNSINALLRTRVEILGYFAPRKSESKVEMSRKQVDLSHWSDEQLERYIKHMEALEEIAREAGMSSDDETLREIAREASLYPTADENGSASHGY